MIQVTINFIVIFWDNHKKYGYYVNMVINMVNYVNMLI